MTHKDALKLRDLLAIERDQLMISLVEIKEEVLFYKKKENRDLVKMFLNFALEKSALLDQANMAIDKLDVAIANVEKVMDEVAIHNTKIKEVRDGFKSNRTTVKQYKKKIV